MKVFERKFILSLFVFKGLFRKIVLISSVLLFFNSAGTTPGIGYDNFSSAYCKSISEEKMYIISVKNRIHDQLVNQVERYIKKIAPDSKLSAEILVTVCENYDLDINFVMAQALLESHFGTRGKAAITNSVWNVGTYDNGIIKYTYKDPNESIEPYASLLYRNYLMWADSTKENKNLLDLLEDTGFVNYNGHRFASNKKYEDGLRKLMIKIDMETSISMLQGIRRLSDMQLLTYFKPVSQSESDFTEFYASNY